MEKKELIQRAIYTDLPLRDKLDMNDTKFGVEIETSLSNEEDKFFLLSNDFTKNGWSEHQDPSIKKGISFELASPVYIDNDVTWKELKLLSDRLKKCKINYEQCSFQTTINCCLNDIDIVYFLKFFAIYEKVIYRFSMGFDSHLRDNIKVFSTSLRDELNDRLKLSDDAKVILERFLFNKYYGVSLKGKLGTIYSSLYPVNLIEFRTPNGTDDVWLWQNYINTFYNIIRTFEVGSIDYEKIDYLYYRLFGTISYDTYEDMHLDKAIEFANIIFNNDRDKLYFIKQYIGKQKDKALTLVK